MTRNILVTGGNGFIGSHLVDRLASQPGTSVTVFDIYPRLYGPLPAHTNFIQGNLNDIGSIRKALVDFNIKLVYHTAWANIPESAQKNVIADLETNVIPTVHLLDACCEVGIKRFIFLSSGGGVYGIPNKIPIPESHPTNPINAYGVTKLTIEKYLGMYEHLYGLENIILRPSVPYGPRQNPHRRQGVVSAFIYNALMKRPVIIWGNGKDIIRDFFYIDDLVEALIQVQEIPAGSEAVYNLGGSTPYSLDDIVRIVQDVLGIAIEVRQESPRAFDVPHLVLDISHAMNVLRWSPKTSVENGVARTANWIKENIIKEGY